MSTNHTPNYNLCQWEATDQVLRSDFNQDNAKIDAALTNKLGRATLLKTASCSGNSYNYRISLEEIDWSKWEYVVVHSNLSHSSITAYFHVQDDGGGNVSFPAQPFIAVFLPRHDSSRMIEFIFLSSETQVRHLTIPFSSLTYIGFHCSSSAFPTANFSIYGI